MATVSNEPAHPLAVGTWASSSTADSKSERYLAKRLAAAGADYKGVAITNFLLGAGVAALLWLAVGVLAEHWLISGGLPRWARWAWLAAAVVALAAGVLRWVVPLVRYRVNLVYAARAIEREFPDLHNDLVNAVLVSSDDEGTSPRMVRSLKRRAARQLSGLPAEDAVVDRSLAVRLAYTVAVLVGLACLYEVFAPKSLLTSSGRLLAPWTAIASPSRAQIMPVELAWRVPGDDRDASGEMPAGQAIEVRGATATIVRGRQLIVATEIRGLRDHEQPTIAVRPLRDDGAFDPAAKPWQMVMERSRPGDAGGRFVAVLPDAARGLDSAVELSLTAGDARTEAIRVMVVEAPSLLVQEVRYDYPAYTRQAAEVVRWQGDLRAVEGTKVTLLAVGNRPIASGWLDFGCDGRRDKPLTVNASDLTRATASFDLQVEPTAQRASYRLLFEPRELAGGSRQLMTEDLQHRIEVLPDMAPEISLEEPLESPLRVPPDAPVQICVRAVDPDFGLARVGLEVRLKDGPPGQEIVLLAEEKNGLFEGGSLLVPRQFGGQPGATLEYRGVAVDNRPQRPNETRTPWQTLIIDERAPARQPRGEAGDAGQQPQGDTQPKPNGDEQNQGAKQTRDGEQPKGDKQSGGSEQPRDGQAGEPQAGEGQSQDGRGQAAQGGQDKPGEGQRGQDNSSEVGNGRKDKAGQDNGSESRGGQGGAGDATDKGAQQKGAQQGSQRAGPERNGDPQQAGGQQSKDGQPAGDQQGAKRPGQQPSGEQPKQPGGQQPRGQEKQPPRDTVAADGTNDGEAMERILKHRQQQNRDGGEQSQGSAQPQDGQSKEGQPKDGQQNNGQQQKDGQQKDGQQKDGQQKDGPPCTDGKPCGEEGCSTCNGGAKAGGSKPGSSGAGGQSGGGQPGGQQPGSQSQTGGNEQGGQKPGGQDGQQAGGQSGDGGQQRSEGGQNQGAGGEQAGEAVQQGKGGQQGQGGRQPNSQPDAGSQSGSGDQPGSGGQQADQKGKPSGQSEGKEAAGENAAGQQAGTNPGESADGEPGAAESRKNSAAGQQEQAGAGNKPGNADQQAQQAGDGQPSSGRETGDGAWGGGEAKPQTDRPDLAGDREQRDLEWGDEDLSHARNAADLAVEHLRDSVAAGESDVLDALGWSREEAQAFIDRWRAMRRLADSDDPRQRGEFERAVRSLGLRPGGVRSSRDVQTDVKGGQVEGRRSRPPSEYRDQVRAFLQGTNNE